MPTVDFTISVHSEQDRDRFEINYEKVKAEVRKWLQDILDAANLGMIDWDLAIDIRTKTVIFDLEELRAELDHAVWEWRSGDEVEWHRQICIGTVMNLMPSGKYYTPWANSNVEVCNSCREAMTNDPCDEDHFCNPPEDYDGEEPYHCEVCQDNRWREQAEAELEGTGMYMTSGEGSATDIMVGEGGLPGWGDQVLGPHTGKIIALNEWNDWTTITQELWEAEDHWASMFAPTQEEER